MRERVSERRLPPFGKSLVVAIPVVIALLLAYPLVGAPLNTLAVIVGLVLAVVLLMRVEWAVLTFVAVSPFEDYVRTVSGSAVKGLGGLVVLAWLIHAAAPGLQDRGSRLLSRGARRGGLSHPTALAGFAMVAVVLASTVLHPNGSVGAEVVTRYMSFLGALIVLIDCLYQGLPVRRVAAAFVGSCAVAAVFGLGHLLGGATRAGGPIGDPNDFAFFMVAALPLALVLRRTARRAIVWDVAALLIVGAMVATLSRGAVFAMIAMLAYAVFTGVIRARVVGLLVAAFVVLVAVLSVTKPGLIENSLAEKQYVASQNVDERLIRWQVTAQMTVNYPVLGIGPGGFRLNYDRYVDVSQYDLLHPLDVAHETYLEVSAELGLAGLATFLAVLGYGFAGAYRRTRLPDAQSWLAGGVCAAMLGTVVAAIFLTEQYFLPLWMLAAFGAAMDPRHRGADLTSDDDRTVLLEKGTR